MSSPDRRIAAVVTLLVLALTVPVCATGCVSAEASTQAADITQPGARDEALPREDREPGQTSQKPAAPADDHQLSLTTGLVTRVVDGDTAHIRLEDGRTEKVRFIGVDTPESTTEHEPYGEVASAYTKKTLLDQTVYLEQDAEQRDRYGRLLAYVWMAIPTAVDENLDVSDEQIARFMFNAWLVGEGYANTMTIPPNVKYAEDFLRLQRQARDADRGLWNEALLKGAESNADSSVTAVGRAKGKVVGNCNSLKFHRADCGWAKRIATSHRVAFKNRQEAIEAGYVPCKVCKP